MRKSTIVKIDDLEVTIKELRVRDIYTLMDGADKGSLLDQLDTVLPRCSDLKREKMMDMTPSDLKLLWEGFKEVNDSFLEIAAALGFGVDVLPDLIKSVLQEQLMPSSPEATAE